MEAALAQGRDVMAVPGPITSPTSVGTNRLLRDGATPFLEPVDLLASFPERPGGRLSTVQSLLRRCPRCRSRRWSIGSCNRSTGCHGTSMP